MNESDALAQFVSLDNREICGKCSKLITNESSVYPDKYFVADWGKSQIQVCENCFDSDIRNRMF